MKSTIVLNRREVAAGLVAACALAPSVRASDQPVVTAAEVVRRIQQECLARGVQWSDRSADGFKAGDPQTPVRGIVTSFMSTWGLLEKARDAGANFVISHEPTFWNTIDNVAEVQDDPLYVAKRAFIENNGMVVWRFHDHWHALRPEPMVKAFVRNVGWSRFLAPGQVPAFDSTFRRPPVTLAAFARELKERLPSRSIRVIGDPNLQISTFRISGHGVEAVIPALEAADCAVVFEVRDANSGEYVRDLVDTGAKKAMIELAHERGEQGMMADCAAWVRSFVRERRVTFIPSGEPFWTPLAVPGTPRRAWDASGAQ